MEWTNDRIAFARRIIEQDAKEDSKQRKTYRDAAEQLTAQWDEVVTDEQLRSALRRDVRRGHYSDVRAQTRRCIPATRKRQFRQALEVNTSGALIIADLHAPYHSQAYLNQALDIAAMTNISDVFILGDLFNFDSISRHPRNAPITDINEDICCVGAVLSAIANESNVRRIIINSGNHDEWLARQANTNLSFEHLINAAIGNTEMSAE